MLFGRIKLPHKIRHKRYRTISDRIIHLNDDLIKHDLKDLVCSRVEEALIEMYLAGDSARRAWVAGYQKITHAAHHIAGNPTGISRWIKSLPLYTVHNNEQKFFI